MNSAIEFELLTRFLVVENDGHTFFEAKFSAGRLVESALLEAQ